MRLVPPVLAAAFLLLPATAAPATSMWPVPPHDPRAACAAIGRVVDGLNAGRLTSGDEAFPRGAFYSEALGKVEDGEEEKAFLHAMRHSEGKPDSAPVRLHRVYAIERSKRGRQQATYLVLLRREAWHETSLRSDDDFNTLSVERVADPHYGTDTSYWLATFDSEKIRHFREAPELYFLIDEDRELKGCPRTAA